MSFAAAVERLHRQCVSTFGEAATLDGSPVTGIYRAPFVVAFDGIATSNPRFEIVTADAPNPFDGTLVCAAGTFRVRSVQPDGTGWSVLELEAP